jgi:hypothetical protein
MYSNDRLLIGFLQNVCFGMMLVMFPNAAMAQEWDFDRITSRSPGKTVRVVDGANIGNREIEKAKSVTDRVATPTTALGEHVRNTAKDIAEGILHPTWAQIKVDLTSGILDGYWEVKELKVWGGPGKFNDNTVFNDGNGIAGLYQWMATFTDKREVKVCSGTIRITGPNDYLININVSDLEWRVYEHLNK